MRALENKPGKSVNRSAVWNPMILAILCVPFSFFSTGILYVINYKRLGYPELAKQAFFYVVVGFLFFTAGSGVLADTWQMRGFLWMINLGVAVVFYQTQREPFEEHLAAGGKEASMLIPLVIAVGWHLVVMFGSLWLRYGG